MATNILITGVSGYLGGTIAAQLPSANLPSHGTIYALVRGEKQEKAVADLGLQPIRFDPYNEAEVENALLVNGISVVFWLIDAFKADAQSLFIQALAKVKAQTGNEVHFLHVRVATS